VSISTAQNKLFSVAHLADQTNVFSLTAKVCREMDTEQTLDGKL